MTLRKMLFGNKKAEKPADSVRRLVRSIDTDRALCAHEHWKEKLQAHLQGKSTEQACDGSECAMGRWLRSESAGSLGQYSSFSALRDSHQRFHDAAAEMLVLAEIGRQQDAEQLLNGELVRLNHNIVQQLHILQALD